MYGPYIIELLLIHTNWYRNMSFWIKPASILDSIFLVVKVALCILILLRITAPKNYKWEFAMERIQTNVKNLNFLERLRREKHK